VLQPGGKRAQPGQAVGVGADGGDPRRQALAAELDEQLAEGPDVASGRPQLRAVLQDLFQL